MCRIYCPNILVLSRILNLGYDVLHGLCRLLELGRNDSRCPGVLPAKSSQADPILQTEVPRYDTGQWSAIPWSDVQDVETIE